MANKKPNRKRKVSDELVKKGYKKKSSTRLRKAVATTAKRPVHLSKKRSVKSRFYQDIKNYYIGIGKNKLTANQQEFINAITQIAEQITKQSESLGIILDIVDILPVLPEMPIRITKKFLSKLLGEALEQITKQVIPDFNVSWNKPYPKLSIMDKVIDWINERIPDIVSYRSGAGWITEDMNQYKEFLISLVSDHWNDSDEGKAYAQHLLDNQKDILSTVDHFPYVSTQADFDQTIGRLFNVITQNTVTPYGEAVQDKVNEVLSGGYE